MSRMSRPRIAAPRLAASRFGRPPLRAGAAAIAASEQRPPAGDARMPQGCLQGCAPEGPALKCRLNVLYVPISPRCEGGNTMLTDPLFYKLLLVVLVRIGILNAKNAKNGVTSSIFNLRPEKSGMYPVLLYA